MKFLRRLLGKQPDTLPSWEVTPAELRPPPRGRAAQADPEAPPTAKKPATDNPFLNEAFSGFELESDGEESHDDPYSSQSWKVSKNDESRKLKALNIGCKTERPDPEDFNPYDTGVFKRGWK